MGRKTESVKVKGELGVLGVRDAVFKQVMVVSSTIGNGERRRVGGEVVAM